MEHESPSPSTPTEREPQPDTQRIELALRTLEGFRAVDFRAHPENLLPRPMFELLDGVRQRLNLPAVWMSEHLFRCALAYGADRDTLRAWAVRYAQAAGAANPGATAPALLDADSLRRIDQQRETSLAPTQLAQIVDSLLAVATDADRDRLRYWTQRLASPPSQEPPSPSQETVES